MSTSITIGEVPDEVRDELTARAALSGRSVEDYIRDELIALARRPSAAVWMARVRARKDALQHQPPAEATGDPSSRDRSMEEPGDRRSAAPSSEPRASQAPLIAPQRDVG